MEGWKKKRGRKKQSKPRNLLDRFRDYRTEVLRFVHDFDVPFTNNQGEQDIRMMKVQQKISGCFRSKKGADFHSRIRGYISTVKKQAINTLDAIASVFAGEPLLFDTS